MLSHHYYCCGMTSGQPGLRHLKTRMQKRICIEKWFISKPWCVFLPAVDCWFGMAQEDSLRVHPSSIVSFSHSSLSFIFESCSNLFGNSLSLTFFNHFLYDWFSWFDASNIGLWKVQFRSLMELYWWIRSSCYWVEKELSKMRDELDQAE